MAKTAITADVDRDGSQQRPPVIARFDQREYAMVPLASIRVHPLNLRTELRDVDELADSIRQNGLLEPVLLVPDPEPAEDGAERFLLVAGHRRHAGCVAARHDPVEAIIRHDLDGDGAQVIAMLTENGPRDDLTPIEEAHGYQLALDLNHLTPAKLAKRLGKPRDRITSRVALTRLPDEVQEKVHARQISLHEAEAMAEFANDASALESLLKAAGTSNFQYKVQQHRVRRESAQRVATLRKELQQAGARVIERPADYPWSSAEKPVGQFIDPNVEVALSETPMSFTPEAHAAACAFHAAFINPYDCKPEYVCTNPQEAGHESIHRRPAPVVTAPADDPGVDVASVEADRLRQVEEERQRVEEERRQREEAERAEAQRREALEVAARLRASFLTTLVRRSGKAHVSAVLQLLLTEHFEAWLEEADSREAQEFAAMIDARVPESAEHDDDADYWEQLVTDLRVALSTRRTADAIAGALLALAGLDRETALAQGYGWSNASCRRYLDFLVAQGYGLTEIEQELIEGAETPD
jgi:ParB/RepB/Spo0J family partition protein